MKVLLDTNIIIDFFRNRFTFDDNLLESSLYTSIMTIAELMYGAYKSQNPEKNLTLITEFVDKYPVEVINISKEIVEDFAELKALLEISGRKIEDFDIFIACTARKLDLTLMTKNLKHFQRIEGLKIY